MNMGAGRVVYQDLTRIDKSIRDGDFFESPSLVAAMDRVAGGSNALHLIGLVSDGGVHSHLRHLLALIEMAGAAQDSASCSSTSSPTAATRRRPAASRYVAELEEALTKAGVGRIATVSGRYYAMDRDKRWERTKLAYDAVMNGTPAGTEPVPTARSAGAAIQAAYDAGVTDEFIKPIVIVDADGTPVGPMRDGDSLIVLQLPRRSRAPDLARRRARRRPVRRLRAPLAPEAARDDDDGVRPDVQLPGRLHAADLQQQPRGRPRSAWPHQPAAGRDREVRARDLLLQLRSRRTVRRRGSHPRSVTEGCDLRPDAANERAGDRRQPRRRISRAASIKS